jgi:hypothetical protein
MGSDGGVFGRWCSEGLDCARACGNLCCGRLVILVEMIWVPWGFRLSCELMRHAMRAVSHAIPR